MIIVNLNKKGGVGKTTNTIHVASYLASKGKKVLLIDADNQCDLSWSCGVEQPQEAYNIVDFLKGKSDKPEDLVVFQKNLSILPGNYDFEASRYDSFALSKRMKEYGLDTVFDYIFIDVPPAGIAKDVITSVEMALCASDAFLCTIKADIYSVKNLDIFLGTVFSLKEKHKLNSTFLGVYFSDVNVQKSLFKKYKAQIEQVAGEFLFKSYIRSDAEVEKAADEGKTIFQYNPNCRASHDYVNLSKEILKKIKKHCNNE